MLIKTGSEKNFLRSSRALCRLAILIPPFVIPGRSPGPHKGKHAA